LLTPFRHQIVACVVEAPPDRSCNVTPDETECGKKWCGEPYLQAAGTRQHEPSAWKNKITIDSSRPALHGRCAIQPTPAQPNNTASIGSGGKIFALPPIIRLFSGVSFQLPRHIDPRIASQMFIFVFTLKIFLAGIRVSFFYGFLASSTIPVWVKKKGRPLDLPVYFTV
jgi:hypothetical protein